MWNKSVVEPTAVKLQILKAATESACMILRIDDVIASSKSREPPGGQGGPGGGMGAWAAWVACRGHPVPTLFSHE